LKSFWVLVSALFFALMGVFVKLGSAEFSSAELVFYRSLIGVVVTACMMRLLHVRWSTPVLGMHLGRGLVGCLSLVCYFYAIQVLPLATAVTLNHTAPIFFALIGAVWLRERPGLLSIVAIGVGFAGVALLLQPSASGLGEAGPLAGLLAGLTCAILYLFIRRLGQAGEPEPRTVFYFTLVCSAGAGLWMCFSQVHAVTLQNVWLLLGVGISATVAQLALTRAYKTGKSILTTTLTYMNVFFAGAFGIAIWDEVPTAATWVAFLMIIASGVLATVAPVKRPVATAGADTPRPA
jgi:drug/metabolite transporter (DMT)-like permease